MCLRQSLRSQWIAARVKTSTDSQIKNLWCPTSNHLRLAFRSLECPVPFKPRFASNRISMQNPGVMESIDSFYSALSLQDPVSIPVETLANIESFHSNHKANRM